MSIRTSTTFPLADLRNFFHESWFCTHLISIFAEWIECSIHGLAFYAFYMPSDIVIGLDLYINATHCPCLISKTSCLNSLEKAAHLKLLSKLTSIQLLRLLIRLTRLSERGFEQIWHCPTSGARRSIVVNYTGMKRLFPVLIYSTYMPLGASASALGFRHLVSSWWLKQIEIEKMRG